MDDKTEREITIEKYRKGRDKLADDEINAWEDPNFEVYHVTDRYGFIHGERLPERLPEFETKIKNKENTRLNKWLKMLKSWDQFFPDSEKLRTRTYKGIPNALRGEVWSRLLNINMLKQEQSGKYQEMLEYGILYSKDVRQIDLDVNRTYRNHIMFRERYNTKQQMLFRVLVAYSVYNTEVGYCQGMSQIAALLLMYMDEEDAFWSISSLMSNDRHAMHGFFIPGFPKLIRFAKHHDKIIQKFLPKVWKHFKKFDIDSTLYTLKWFFQCFLDRVPFSLTLRLWDVFLLDGEVILTGMSYTLLKLHKRSILRKPMEETIEFLQVELEKDFGYHDDSAIQALQQSIQDLRKYKMLNAERPSESELPSRPFGMLLFEKASLNDDASIAGSVKLRVNDASSVATSRTSEAGSQADLRSLSIYDNVSIGECIAAKNNSRLSNYSKKSSPSPNMSHKGSNGIASPQSLNNVQENSVSPEMIENDDNHHNEEDQRSNHYYIKSSELTDVENQINELSSSFEKHLNGFSDGSISNSTKSMSSSHIERVIISSKDKSFMKMTSKHELVVTKSPNESNSSDIVVHDNHHPHLRNHRPSGNSSSNGVSRYIEKFQEERNETIIINDQMAMASSSFKKESNRGENNSNMTCISIRTPSPSVASSSGGGGSSTSNTPGEPRIKLFSNDGLPPSSPKSSNIRLNNQTTTSPSKIRIFVPYKSESNEGSLDAGTPLSSSKDMPIVET